MSEIWHYAIDDRPLGPVSEQELQALIQAGKLKSDGLIWKPGMADWAPVANFLQFLPPRVDPRPPAPPFPRLRYHVDGHEREAVKGKKLAAGICALFLGCLGVHKFILGNIGPGMVMLLITVLTFGFGAFLMWVIGFSEGIIYLTRTDAEFERTYLLEQKNWF